MVNAIGQLQFNGNLDVCQDEPKYTNTLHKCWSRGPQISSGQVWILKFEDEQYQRFSED